MTVHDFHADLAYAERARRLLVEQLYPRLTGGHFVSLTNSRGSLWLQRNAHIDAVLQLRDGQSLTVEEKIVRGTYNAFAIETIANVELNRPGWLHNCTADYLLYGFTRAGCLDCYMVNLHALRTWLVPVVARYRTSDTPNRTRDGGIYHTRCALVPVVDVRKYVGLTQYSLEE